VNRPVSSEVRASGSFAIVAVVTATPETMATSRPFVARSGDGMFVPIWEDAHVATADWRLAAEVQAERTGSRDVSSDGNRSVTGDLQSIRRMPRNPLRQHRRRYREEFLY